MVFVSYQAHPAISTHVCVCMSIKTPIRALEGYSPAMALGRRGDSGFNAAGNLARSGCTCFILYPVGDPLRSSTGSLSKSRKDTKVDIDCHTLEL